MGIISVSFYKSYFYFVLFWILELSSTLIKEFLDQIYADHKQVNLLFELTNLICINGADLLAGILVLITFIRLGSINESIEKKKKNTIEQELIYNDFSNRKYKYRLLLLISALEFIARYIDFFFFAIFSIKRIRGGEISWLISIDFLSRIFFSSILLKFKIFKHHMVTIILTIISLCTMSACAFIVIDDVDFGNWPYFISIGLKFIIVPLEDVFNKILFNEKFLLPHSLMFIRGIFNLLMFILFIPIFILIKSKHENYFNFHHKEKYVNKYLQIFLVFLYTFLYSFRIFCVMKVIYIFSPQHVAFLNEVFYLFLLLRCRLRAKDYPSVIIIDSFCLIIIIISTLVFNEIIIINSCGLNKNTKNSLLLRESQEIQESNLSINEDNENKNDISNSNSSLECSSEYSNF